MPPVSWHDERRPTFRLGLRGSQALSTTAWTLELGGRAPQRFSEVLRSEGEGFDFYDDDEEESGNGASTSAANANNATTFSDAAFVRNGVAPSAIGYDASLPRAGRPLKINTPRYAADEGAVEAILALLLPEHGAAMSRAGEELDAEMVKRWLQPRAGDARATLQALRVHVAWRTDPKGPFLTSFSASADSSGLATATATANGTATPRSESADGGRSASANGSGSRGGPSLPPRSSSASSISGRRTPRGGGSGGSATPPPPPPPLLLPSAGAGRVDPCSIPVCLSARKACLQGIDNVGRAVVLIRASRHFMTAGSTVEENKKLMAFVLDAAFAAADAERNPARRLLCLFDLKGLGLANCDVKVLAGIFDMLKLHYPERLDAFWFLNAPTIFWALWRVVGPMVNPGTRAKIKFLRGREAAAALAAAVPPHVLPRDLGGAEDSEDLPVERAVEMMDRGEWPPSRPLSPEEAEKAAVEAEANARWSSRRRRSSSSGTGFRLSERGGGLLLSARRQLQHLKHQPPHPTRLSHSHPHAHSHAHSHAHEQYGSKLRRRHSSSAAATPRNNEGENGNGGGNGNGNGNGGGSASAIVGGRRALFAAAFAATFAAPRGRSSSSSGSLPATPSSPHTPRSVASALLSAATARLSLLSGSNSKRLEGEQQEQQGRQQQQNQQQLLLRKSPAAGGIFALLAAVLVGMLSALASFRGIGGGGGGKGRRPEALEAPSSSSMNEEDEQEHQAPSSSPPLSPSLIKRASSTTRPLFRLTAVPALRLAPLRRLLSSAASSRNSSRASTRPSSAESEPLSPPPPSLADAAAAAASKESRSRSSAHWRSLHSSHARAFDRSWRGGGAAGEDEALVLLQEMTS